VEDVMHAQETVPRVSEGTFLREALFEITGKKLGLTTVQDEAGRLLGIITDGDLRRLMEKVGDPLGKRAGEVMTRSPSTIARDEMATVALRMMEERSITSLVVVDGESRVLGVVHLHDLLKAGI
jgi:arabinose-5-phosphate isomerase